MCLHLDLGQTSTAWIGSNLNVKYVRGFSWIFLSYLLLELVTIGNYSNKLLKIRSNLSLS